MDNSNQSLNDLTQIDKLSGHKSDKKFIAATFSGPIPPPNVLAQYDNLQAGFAERIVRMADSVISIF